jgi:hypothetical protein
MWECRAVQSEYRNQVDAGLSTKDTRDLQSPVARPAAPLAVGAPRPIGSEPWFPAEGGAVLAGFELTPTAPLDEHQH